MAFKAVTSRSCSRRSRWALPPSSLALPRTAHLALLIPGADRTRRLVAGGADAVVLGRPVLRLDRLRFGRGFRGLGLTRRRGRRLGGGRTSVPVRGTPGGFNWVRF